MAFFISTGDQMINTSASYKGTQDGDYRIASTKKDSTE